MSQPTVAVIGAGWAGCATAVELARTGAQVTLYEAARVPGGRARRTNYQGKTLDNGQHILLGAYRHPLQPVSYTPFRTHRNVLELVRRPRPEKKNFKLIRYNGLYYFIQEQRWFFGKR